MCAVHCDAGGREKLKYKNYSCVERNNKSIKRVQAVCAGIETGHEG